MKVLATVLLWAAAAYRISVLRRDSTFVPVAYAIAALSVASAFTVAATEATVDSATSPYFSDLLEHGLAVVGGTAANLFLLGLKRGQPSRTAIVFRIAIGLLVLAGMVATFIAAPISGRGGGDLDATYGNLASIVTYRAIFNVYLTYVLIDNVRLCRRYAAVPGDFGRSVSLRFLGWGSAISIGYSLSRLAYIAIDISEKRQIETIRKIGSFCAAVGLCGLAIGMLAPSSVRRLHDWWEASRGARQLEPLWSAVTARWPELILSTGMAWTPRQVELRFDRMLIETSEGLARAKVHLNPDEPADLQARHILATLSNIGSSNQTPRSRVGAGMDRDEELSLLLKVSHAFSTLTSSGGASDRAAA